MNCEIAHERIVTAAYGELPDEQAHELERHLTGCADCQGERQQLLALKLLADAHPVAEPPANLWRGRGCAWKKRSTPCRQGAGMNA